MSRRTRRFLRASGGVTVGLAFLVGGVTLLTGRAEDPVFQDAPLPRRTFDVTLGSLPPLTGATAERTGLASPTPMTRTQAGAAADAAGRLPARTRGSCGRDLRRNVIAIPSLCAFGPTVDTSEDLENELTIPKDVRTVGVWDRGAPLLAADGRARPIGTTLLAGHVNAANQGRGTLYALYRVRAGALVYVVDGHGRVTRWRVTSLSIVAKGHLPPSIFAGRSGPRQLVLVTCGGPVVSTPTGHTYLDNVVATARPA